MKVGREEARHVDGPFVWGDEWRDDAEEVVLVSYARRRRVEREIMPREIRTAMQPQTWLKATVTMMKRPAVCAVDRWMWFTPPPPDWLGLLLCTS